MSPFLAQKFVSLDDLPYDAYCPSVVGRVKHSTCPVGKHLPSPAQMLVHRRSLHKYSRAALEEDFESKLYQPDFSAIECVVWENEDGFICVMKSGVIEAIKLDRENPLVKAYLKNVVEDRSLASTGLPPASVKEWAELKDWAELVNEVSLDDGK